MVMTIFCIWEGVLVFEYFMYIFCLCSAMFMVLFLFLASDTTHRSLSLCISADICVDIFFHQRIGTEVYAIC